MARFNPKTSTAKPTVVNRAGGQAYQQSDKMELVSMLLTNLVQDQFYRKSGESINRLRELVVNIEDPKFAAKAGIYARQKYGMRSITHVLAGEIVHRVKGEEWTKDFIRSVVKRPDDMTEILSYYLGAYGKPIPKCLKKGLALTVVRFDDYQIAKYRGNGNKLSMIDLVNLCHPKATKTLTKLMKGTLASADTWETKLSSAGQVAETDDQKLELKGAAWSDLINENKLGYFALLRNLRNIKEQAGAKTWKKALVSLVDEQAIKKSMVFPFRFLTAYQEVEDKDGLIALSKAIDLSLSNVPVFEGKTLVVLDCSGSMSGGVGKYNNNNMSPAKIGSLFASVLWKSNDSDFMLFSDDAAYVTDARWATLPIMELSKRIIRSMSPAGTNFPAIFARANKAYDRVIILSDMQGWMGQFVPRREFSAYKSKYKCSPKIYSFDLQGYGDMQFPEPNVYCLAGFSDKVFDLMKMLETDRNALVHEIEKIQL